MSRSNENRYTTGWVNWPESLGRAVYGEEQAPGFYDSGEGGLWVFLFVPSQGMDDPFENCCMHGVNMCAPDVLVGGSWPGKMGQVVGDGCEDLQEEIWPGIREHYDDLDRQQPHYIAACKGCGYSSSTKAAGQVRRGDRVVTQVKAAFDTYQQAMAAAVEHAENPDRDHEYLLAPHAEHEPIVLETRPLRTPPNSRDLLAAVCLGSNRHSFVHSSGGYFNCDYQDLTEQGKQLYDSLKTLYQREPLLITLLDT